jgi:hypothetical protein
MPGAITLHPEQPPCDVAVVVPTILRPTLLRAVRSVYAQDLGGRIHLLIGVDIRQGSADLLDTIRAECPSHVMLTVLDLGYSTSQRHGGVYSNYYGGSLRTVLSYAANSRRVAYLDDNDWWARDHLSSLLAAIGDKAWAFSGRWLVEPETEWPICLDEWDSLGPGRGINAERFGGFCQPSTLLLDKMKCHPMLPRWSVAAFADGSGEDRLVFDILHKQFSWAASGRHSAFCILSPDAVTHEHHAREFRARGIFWPERRELIAEARRLEGEAQHLAAAGRIDEAAAAWRAVLAINPHAGGALRRLADLRPADSAVAVEYARRADEAEGVVSSSFPPA